MAAQSHPKNVLGGAEERKINRVFVDSVTVVIIILFYFILFFGEIHILTSNKNGGGNYYTKDFFIFGKKLGPIRHIYEKKNSEFAIYRQ